MKNKQKGFTLIELMVVVAITAILAAIALPSYAEYGRRAIASAAQQEMLKLAEQLERHKGKNFSYKNFSAEYLYKDGSSTSPCFTASTAQLTLPIELINTPAQCVPAKYTLTLRDGDTTSLLLTSASALGQKWAVKAVSSDIKNYSFLLRSDGVRCKNKVAESISYDDCGTDTEAW